MAYNLCSSRFKDAITVANGEFTILEAIYFSWEKTKSNCKLLIPIWVIYSFVSYVITYIVHIKGALWALGFIYGFMVTKLSLLLVDNQRVSWSKVFPSLREAVSYTIAYTIFDAALSGWKLLTKIPRSMWRITWLAFFVIIVWVWFVTTRFSFFSFPIVDRQAGPIEALRESYQITRRVWPKIILVLLLILLMSMIMLINRIIGTIAIALYGPIISIVFAFMYRRFSEVYTTTQVASKTN